MLFSFDSARHVMRNILSRHCGPLGRAHVCWRPINRDQLWTDSFLNRVNSLTLDTACSGSLVGVDVACRYLQTGEISGAIVAGANLYIK